MKVFALTVSFGLLTCFHANAIGQILKHPGIVISSCVIPSTAALAFDDGPNYYEVKMPGEVSLECTHGLHRKLLGQL
jgi:hypothetical protein